VYDAAGGKDPKWDADARVAIDAWRRKVVDDLTRTGDEEDLNWEAGHRARVAGCTDPMMLYGLARNLNLRTRDPTVLAGPHMVAAKAFRGSTYPPYREAAALFRAAEYAAGCGDRAPAGVRPAREYADAGLALLPAVFADASLPVSEARDLFSIMMQATAAYGGDARPMHDAAMKAIDASALPRGAALTAKGALYAHYAWHARGNGAADTVTEQAGASFEERLGEARRILEAAWATDPGNADAAIAMLDVERGAPSGPGGLDLWYTRATKADPDSRAAASRKMEGLEPKWGGSRGRMLKFGRELLASGNWDAGLPLLLAEAHWTLACWENGNAAFPDPAYFRRNAAAVWPDVKAVYDPYLAKVPGSRFHRTRYALVAAWCGRWAEAEAQFKILGDNPSRRATLPELVQRTRAESAAKAGPAATEPPPLPF
jgi:hypothetical protein